MGRPCIFRGKRRGHNEDVVWGLLTQAGMRDFQRHRRRLARLSGLAVPSDADVIEWLVRGEVASARYLEQNPVRG